MIGVSRGIGRALLGAMAVVVLAAGPAAAAEMPQPDCHGEQFSDPVGDSGHDLLVASQPSGAPSSDLTGGFVTYDDDTGRATVHIRVDHLTEREVDAPFTAISWHFTFSTAEGKWEMDALQDVTGSVRYRWTEWNRITSDQTRKRKSGTTTGSLYPGDDGGVSMEIPLAEVGATVGSTLSGMLLEVRQSVTEPNDMSLSRGPRYRPIFDRSSSLEDFVVGPCGTPGDDGSASGSERELWPTGEGSANVQPVANLQYRPRNGGTPNYGSDIELAEIDGREYALAGSYLNGMQIVDVTEPDQPRIAGVYDCGVIQGDVQVFRQEDEPGRVFATYTSDGGDRSGRCWRDARSLGHDPTGKPNGWGGTFIVDVSDPANPRTVGFAPVGKGSHNQTVHPSGDYMYNSNSDPAAIYQQNPEATRYPAIEVFDISDPAAPEQVAELKLPLAAGRHSSSESHDITFSRDGRRAYSAALSQGVIIDSSDPANPTVVSTFMDPSIGVWHQADPVRIGHRTFLIVSDEFAGVTETRACPSGGLHVYDITGEHEQAPVKVGYFNIDDLRATTRLSTPCTAHVFQVHEEAQLMTVGWYHAGVRILDLSGLAGIGASVGEHGVGEGIREIGHHYFSDADVWAAKSPRIKRGKDFHVFANDVWRGLDVYRFDADAPAPKSKGTWKSGRNAGPPSPIRSGTVAPLDLVREGRAPGQDLGHHGHGHEH